MSKRGKAYAKAKERVEEREYILNEAIALLKEIKASKFDESVDVSVRLSVDPKYPEQMVRGTVVLPHGTGKVKTGTGHCCRRKTKGSHGGRCRFRRRR